MLIRLAARAAVLFVWSTAAFAQTVSVSGTVRAERDKQPIAGAVISIAGTSAEATCGADGRFTLPAIAPGTYTVVATRGGFAPATSQVTVAASGMAELDVLLPDGLLVNETLTVQGRLSDYVETSAMATRSSARLIDVPQAIAVLPARLLEDVGALDTKDLYRHISGVVDSPYSSTVVRGFTQREVLVNGARGNAFGSLEGDVASSGFSTSQFRLTNVERVEVLKGPASVLYGPGEPGGVLNYVTKKPKDVFQVRAVAGTGRFNQRYGEADVTGPANASRTLLYRAAAYYEDRDHFRTPATEQNLHLATGLTWRVTPRAALSAEYEYLDQDMGGHRLRGVPVNANGDFLADYRWSASEPTDFTNLKAHVAQLRWDQAFARGIRFDSTLRYLQYDREEAYHEPRGITADGLFMQREFRSQLRTNDDVSWNAILSVPWRTGAVAHDIAVGGDLYRQDHLFRSATALQRSRGGPVGNIALTNPAYGVDATTYGLTPASYGDDTADILRSGLFVQDLMSLGARWKALVGGRVDHYDDEGRNRAIVLEATQSAVTGRFGLVFQPTPQTSLFGSIANGFQRPAILAQAPSANGPHDPETALQVEVGAKGDLLQGRLQSTVALFRGRKSNILRPDPALGPAGANANAVLSVGEAVNRGLELDVAGQITPRWNVAFNYAYIDSEITKDVLASVVGKPLPNVAPHLVGLFTRLDVTRTTSLAVSLQHVGDREEPYAGIRAKAFTIADAHVYQTLTDWLRVQVRLENVFDRRYATSSLFAARAGNFPGQPRTLSVQVVTSWARR